MALGRPWLKRENNDACWGEARPGDDTRHGH
jgi:hypothetical protein